MQTMNLETNLGHWCNPHRIIGWEFIISYSYTLLVIGWYSFTSQHTAQTKVIPCQLRSLVYSHGNSNRSRRMGSPFLGSIDSR